MRNLETLEMDINRFMEEATNRYLNNYSALLRVNKKRAFALFERDLRERNPFALNNIGEFFNIVLGQRLNLRYYYIERFLRVANTNQIHYLLLATDLKKLECRKYYRDGLKRTDFRKNILLSIVNGDYDEEEKFKMIEEIMERGVQLSDEHIRLLLSTGYIKDKSLSNLNGCTIASAELLVINNKVHDLFFAYRYVDEEEYIRTIKSSGEIY